MSDFLGLYGKVPSRGDFISRGLSREFIDPWDRWLQSAIATSRQQLGDEWLNHYLTSPIWRFALTSGICGSHTCFGVMMPSVDRVGRYFPLILVQGCDPKTDIMDAIPQLDEWYVVLEEMALLALDDNLSVDDFHSELLDSPFPYTAKSDNPSSSTGGIFDQGMYRALISDTGNLNDSLKSFHQSMVKRLFPGTTLWVTSGSDSIPSSMMVFDGLPGIQNYSALLNGNWNVPLQTPPPPPPTETPTALSEADEEQTE